MHSEVYEKLRKQLDQYSVGFPATESGVEMRILKRLFTEQEAEMYLNLSLMLESPDVIAQRTGKPVETVAEILEAMFQKGLIFRLSKGNSVKYGASAFVVGIFEFQVETMDVELARLCEEYMEEAFSSGMSEITVPMRTVPVNRAVDVAWNVLPYEDSREIIKSKDRIAVARCVCRVQQGLIEKGCDKPLEVCFSFGSHADYYVDKGMARRVGLDEALEILDRCEEAGLVPQPFNAQNPGGLCNCCGDCCGVLRALKKQPRPVEKVVANYYAVVDPQLCNGCETCLERCQMDAVIMDNDVARIDVDRCIGCGLCVVTCTGKALSLYPKEKDERRDPPQTAKDTMMEMMTQRGTSLVPLSIL